MWGHSEAAEAIDGSLTPATGFAEREQALAMATGLPAGATLAQSVNGTALFSWTPAAGDARAWLDPGSAGGFAGIQPV